MKRDDKTGQHIGHFTFIKVLGEGAWATVYEAVDDDSRNIVAIKVIATSLLQQTPKLEQLIKTEISVLKSCKNDNVIRFVETFKSSRSIYIATQFCNGGDLENYLLKKKIFSQDEATTFLQQILNGFKGLHEVGAMHRDFKLANILLHNNTCKIADLGFAKQMSRKQTTGTILGTMYTMAPEVLEQKMYGFQADIWSIGIVYYQMLYGKCPYLATSNYLMLQKIRNSKPDFSRVSISQAAKDFINRCLTIDPKKRISWREIYQHPLITGKKEGFNLIYGSLKSKISINGNANWYQKGNLDNKKMQEKKNDVEFQDIEEVQNSINLDNILEEVEILRQKQDAFQRYQKTYIAKRNDCMFVFKFIAPYVQFFHNIKANHCISLFVMSKKAYLDLNQLKQDIANKKNIFGFEKYFVQFYNLAVYRTILDQIKTDVQIIQAQCICFSYDIGVCAQEISAQFDLRKVASPSFNKLVDQMVDQYWFLLAEALNYVQKDKKCNLIKVLEALDYYKGEKKIEAEQFDRLMTMINYEKAEKSIVEKFSQIFE